MSVRISLVIATYNRKDLLLELLRDLADQTVAPDTYEVLVVDDGSAEPVRPEVEALTVPYRLEVFEQANAGQAAARHRGIQHAAGEIIVILDDDMRVPPDFLAQHLKAHEEGMEVVLGFIVPQDGDMPLFERWHARMLLKWAEAVSQGTVMMRGTDLATGNVSFRRDLYLRVGGFDASLKRSEDRELGVRFEQAGANMGLSREAKSTHHSDHESLAVWLGRAFNYGVYDLRISRKHPEDENADPWKFIFLVSPLSRPLLLLSSLAPVAGKGLARAAMAASQALDRAGLEGPAMAGTTVVYGLTYFQGMREEAGSVGQMARDFGGYLMKRGRERLRRGLPSRMGAVADFVANVKADRAQLETDRAKYLQDEAPASLPKELVTKIGLQMMTAVRAMRLVRDAGSPTGAKVVSRLIRHLYGAEIHWDAEFAPGVVIIHGNGLVVSHAAKVGPGCILAHNVTLGHAVDPATGKGGAPTLGENVHVGPGALLLGDIELGDGTKVMGGAVLDQSVPERALVRPPAATVGKRGAKRTNGRAKGARVEAAPQPA